MASDQKDVTFWALSTGYRSLATEHCPLITAPKMNSTTVIIIASSILLAVAFVIAKMAIRWAVRLAMIGAILVAVLGVAGFWWWTNNLADKPHSRPSPSPNRRSANR